MPAQQSTANGVSKHAAPGTAGIRARNNELAGLRLAPVTPLAVEESARASFSRAAVGSIRGRSRVTSAGAGSASARSAAGALPPSAAPIAAGGTDAPPRPALEEALRHWLRSVGAMPNAADPVATEVDDMLAPRPDALATALAQMATKASLPAYTAASAAASAAATIFDVAAHMGAEGANTPPPKRDPEMLLRSLITTMCEALVTGLGQPQQPDSGRSRSAASPDLRSALRTPMTPAMMTPNMWRVHAAARQARHRQASHQRRAAPAAGGHGDAQLSLPTTPGLHHMGDLPHGFVGFDESAEVVRTTSMSPARRTTGETTAETNNPASPLLSATAGGANFVTSGTYSHPSSTAVNPLHHGAGSPSNSQTSIMSLMMNAPQHTLTAAVGEEMDDGTVDVNQYVLLQLLGRGRQGEVFLAMDGDVNELRAVKVVRRPKRRKAAFGAESQPGSMAGAPLALARDRARQQLEREISIMKKCRHRNVVTLYEVIDDPDQDCMYLVMQYVEHGTIVNLGPDGVPDRTVAPCLLAHYARQLCAGLQYLHKHGVIHRDIKPDNILLGPQDTVYLADFGMADAFDDEPETPASCACREKSHAVRGTRGTVAFMAPELVDATASTSATGEGVDVWALGVTLYTLLYGRLPWDLGAGAMDVMRQITSRPIEFPELPHVDTPPTPAAHDSCDSGDDGALRQSSLGLAFSQDTATMSPRSRRSSDAFALTGGVATATPTPTAAGGRLQTFPSVQSPLGPHEPRPPATVAPPKAATINIAEAWPQLLRGMLCRDPSQRLSLRSVRRRVVDLDAVYVRQRQCKALRDSVVTEEEEPITQLVRRPPQPQHHQHQLHHGMIPSQE